jgi:hypothetical protein
MFASFQISHRFASPPLLLACAAGVALALAAPAQAQDLDVDAYERAAEECASTLSQAQQAAESGDDRRAMVYLDLGSDACARARRAVTRARARLEDEAWHEMALDQLLRDLETAELLVALGECDTAFQRLEAASRLHDALPGSTTERFSAISHAVLRCRARPPSEDLATYTPAPGLVGSHRGVARADAPAAERFGPGCGGRIPGQPSFRLDLPYDEVVTVSVDSANDLVLVVSGSGLVYCGDDEDGWNPIVSERLLAGTYDVYVGEFLASEGGSPYEAAIYLGSPPGPARGASLYGDAVIGPGSPPTLLEGELSGHTDASGLGPDCAGTIETRPHHRLTVTDTTPVWIEAMPNRTDADLSLLLRGDGGTRCCNDASGPHPALLETLAAGTYDLFVGRVGYSGWDYTLLIAEGDPADEAAAALRGERRVTPSAERPSAEVYAWATGHWAAHRRFDAHCLGFISARPQVELVIVEAGEYAITAESEGDTTLVLDGPSGTFCSDDWAGHNPGIFTRLDPGSYRIWLGRFRGEPAGQIRIERLR